MLPPRNPSGFSSSLRSHSPPDGGRAPGVHTFGAHAPALATGRIPPIALPVSPTAKTFDLLVFAFAHTAKPFGFLELLSCRQSFPQWR